MRASAECKRHSAVCIGETGTIHIRLFHTRNAIIYHSAYIVKIYILYLRCYWDFLGVCGLYACAFCYCLGGVIYLWASALTLAPR